MCLLATAATPGPRGIVQARREPMDQGKVLLTFALCLAALLASACTMSMLATMLSGVGASIVICEVEA